MIKEQRASLALGLNAAAATGLLHKAVSIQANMGLFFTACFFPFLITA
jgi:hypothetical protein